MNETTMTVEMPAKVNKSKLILDTFKEKGVDTPSKDIVESIKKAHGVDVTVNLVNVLRLNLRRAKEERKARRQKTVVPVQDEALARLFAVKEFAGKVGGISALKDLLNQLEQLTA